MAKIDQIEVPFKFTTEGHEKIVNALKAIAKETDKMNKKVKGNITFIEKQTNSYGKNTKEVKRNIFGLKKHKDQLDKNNKSIIDITRGNRILGGSLAVLRSKILIVAFALRMLQQTVGNLLKSYGEQQRVEAKLAQVLKSTGNAAGFTTGQLTAYAASLSAVTRFGDESIINAQAMMATFTNLSGTVFKEAIKISLDLSEAFDQGLKESAIQVGKALNDPIKGLTALSRIGVTFSDEEREMVKQMVKMNETANAQNYILGIMRTQFGGTSRAIGSAAKATALLENAWGDMKELLGEVIAPTLIPVLESLARILRNVTDTELERFTSQLISLGVGEEELEKMTKRFLLTQVNVWGKSSKEVQKYIDVDLAAIVAMKDIEIQAEMVQNAMNNMGEGLLKVNKDFADQTALVVSLHDELAGLGVADPIFLDAMRAMISADEVQSRIDEMGESFEKGSQSWTEVAFGTVSSILLGVKEGAKILINEFVGSDFEGPIKKLNKALDAMPTEQAERVMGLLEQLALETDALDLQAALKVDVSESNERIIELLMALGLIPEKVAKTGSSFTKMWESYGKEITMAAQLTNQLGTALEQNMTTIDNAAKQREVDAANQIANSQVRANKLDTIDKKYAKIKEKRDKEIRKIQTAQAIINTALSMTQVYADPTVNSYAKPFLAAMMGALGAIQIATIQGVKVFEEGGLIEGKRHSQGGTPIIAEKGEYIMRREAVSALGLEAMNRINRGEGGGGEIVVNVSGNVMTQDFVETDLAEAIRQAARRGTDFGVS